MPLQLAVFDFDLTLTVVHVFNALTGGQAGIAVPPPFAKSELGQLLRVGELESSQPFRNQGGFSVAVFGGQDRVAVVRQLLQDLRAAGVECLVCTKGLVGPVRKILSNLGLLQFFAQVYGITGNTYGSTDFDFRLGGNPAAVGPDASLLGTPDLSSWNTKRDVVARCLQERRLSPNDAVFIDDDPNEIGLVQPICPTIQVSQRAGMTQREIEMLRSLLPPPQHPKEYPYAPPAQELSRTLPPSQGNQQNPSNQQRYPPLPPPAGELNQTRQEPGDRYAASSPEKNAGQEQNSNNRYGQYGQQNQYGQQGQYGQQDQYGQQTRFSQQSQYEQQIRYGPSDQYGGNQRETTQQSYDRQNYGAGQGYGDPGGQDYGRGAGGGGGPASFSRQGYGGQGYEQGLDGSRRRSLGGGDLNDGYGQGDPRANDARPYDRGYGPPRPAWQADGQVNERGRGGDSYDDRPLQQPLANNERAMGNNRVESILVGPLSGGTRQRDDRRRGANRRLNDGQLVEGEERAHGAHVCCFQ